MALRVRIPGSILTTLVLTYPRYIRRWPLKGDADSFQTNPVVRNCASHQVRDYSRPSTDPFARLFLDNMLDILDLLTIREVLLLSIASPCVSQMLDKSAFWKRRIARDMPWLWELTLDDASSNTNWRRLYFDLLNMCNYNAQTRDLGLVNRKRIWKICLPIARSYLQSLQEVEAAAGPQLNHRTSVS